jgi:[ribosomal protein S5]-alanine N-acetyltransferase
MGKVKLRLQKISDAKRFFEILNNPHFIYFSAKPKNLEEEKEYLRKNKEKIKNNLAYNYSIIYGNNLVGGCGVMINQNRKYNGEIGYFIDENYWGLGIATQAVKELTKIAFTRLKLNRVEIIMNPENKASVGVAKNCGYKKEGFMRKAYKVLDKSLDALLYAKVK